MSPTWKHESGTTPSGDTLQPTSGLTDKNGEVFFAFRTRLADTVEVAVNSTFVHQAMKITLKEAWYESTFLVTAYNVAAESDFSGKSVSANGLNTPAREDFLFGGRGVAMQGTGQTLDGRYVSLSNPTAVRWNPGYNGVANPGDAVFRYVATPRGAFANVIAYQSIAVDPQIIPGLHHVYIQSSSGTRVLGTRSADDTGGAICGYHVDHFVGAGKDAMKTWNNEGGNLQDARVKCLGFPSANP